MLKLLALALGVGPAAAFALTGVPGLVIAICGAITGSVALYRIVLRPLVLLLDRLEGHADLRDQLLDLDAAAGDDRDYVDAIAAELGTSATRGRKHRDALTAMRAAFHPPRA